MLIKNVLTVAEGCEKRDRKWSNSSTRTGIRKTNTMELYYYEYKSKFTM